METVSAQAKAFRFLGQVFKVFLVFEAEGFLILLDQHAAHERLIFERLSRGVPELQDLLIPLAFDATEDEAARISARAEELSRMGIRVACDGKQTCRIVSCSGNFLTLAESDLIEIVKGSASAGEGWRRDMLATAACRLAVKEGDPVDAVTAAELLEQALALESPRCPHGRPIWHRMTKEELYAKVDRTL